MLAIPHLQITRIYYRLVVENYKRFFRFPEAGIRGALGYYLYNEITKDFANPTHRNNCTILYKALLGPLPDTPPPPEGPQPRSINLRFFAIPHEHEKAGLEITFFGLSSTLANTLEKCLIGLGEEGIGRIPTRFYIDGMRPPMITNTSDIRIPDSDSIKLVFFTPTTFRHYRKEAKYWHLEMFSWNLLQRIELLCKAHGEMDDSNWNFEELLHEMLSIDSYAETIKANRSRLSSRQNKRIDYSGFTGTVFLEHVSENARTLLSIGEMLGVGKNTTFGGGRYIITI